MVDPAAQATAAEQLLAFERAWLGPAKIAPPVVDGDTRKAYDRGVLGTATTIRPETCSWNQWRAGTYRLFNNRAALMFDVDLQGSGALRWVPEATSLEVNHEGAVFAPAAAPDDLLLPLLKAALEQEKHVINGDLIERTRAAGPFRAAYLPTAPVQDRLRGVVAFPLDDPDMHVVSMRLTVAVAGPDGQADVVWVFD